MPSMNTKIKTFRLTDADLAKLDADCERVGCDHTSMVRQLIHQYGHKVKRVEPSPRGPKKPVESKGKAGRKQ